MKSTSIRKAAAPSSALLKFLRAQTNGAAFFTPNSIVHHACHARPSTSIPVQHGASTARSLGGTQRQMTTCAVQSIDSSLFSLETIWPSRRRMQNHESQSSSHDHIRSASTSTPKRSSHNPDPDDRPSSPFLHRLLHFGRTKSPRPTPLQPSDLPRLSGFLDDHASLGRASRPGNELRLRCTEFDEHGNVTLVNGEFKKSELIQKYGLLPRDLRKIDSSLLPNILVRPSAILINLLHLRVLIKHNRVLVFDAYGSTDSYTQSLFMYDLEGKLRVPEARLPALLASGPNASSSSSSSATKDSSSSSSSANWSSHSNALPYEFRALEAVLISVTTGLEGEFEGVREPVVRVLRELESDIDRDKLRHLLIYSKKLGTFEQKARLVRDAIDELLETDDDLAAMYLTEKARGVKRGEDEHTEVEMLLESYHKVCDEIVQVSGNLVGNIKNTEEIVRAILDANRNSLMLLDLKFSIGTLGLGGGTFVAALYGMNLKNFIEESDFGFWGVSMWSAVISVVVCVYGLKVLRRVQRVSMWGGQAEDRTRGRSGWARLTDGVSGWEKQDRHRGHGHGEGGHGHAERHEAQMAQRERRRGPKDTQWSESKATKVNPIGGEGSTDKADPPVPAWQSVKVPQKR